MEDWKYDIYIKLIEGSPDPFAGSPKPLSISKRKNLRAEAKNYAVFDGRLFKRITVETKEPIIIKENINTSKTYAELILDVDYKYVSTEKVEYRQVIR